MITASSATKCTWFRYQYLKCSNPFDYLCHEMCWHLERCLILVHQIFWIGHEVEIFFKVIKVIKVPRRIWPICFLVSGDRPDVWGGAVLSELCFRTHRTMENLFRRQFEMTEISWNISCCISKRWRISIKEKFHTCWNYIHEWYVEIID